MSRTNTLAYYDQKRFIAPGAEFFFAPCHYFGGMGRLKSQKSQFFFFGKDVIGRCRVF
jgi:hypothetical protein